MLVEQFRLKILTSLALIAAMILPMPAQAAPPVMPTYETIKIVSQVLDEKREVFLYLPEGHDRSQPVPVVYVTDARANFALLVSYLRFSSTDWATMPPMAIVGIANTDRNRDFLPRADARFPGSGGGDDFATFIAEELVPMVDERVGTPSARILVGHSFGGVNAINMMLTRPDVFDAYITIGTSTWVSDKVLFERLRETFAQTSELDAWLYMSVAEADGGTTVSDAVLFAQQIEARSPPGLEFTFEIIARTDHFSAVPPSLHSAFSKLFENWKYGRSVMLAAREGGVDGVQDWFSADRGIARWRVFPATWDMYVAALTLRAEGRFEEALVIVREMQKRVRDLPDFHAAEGEVLLSQGDREGALAALRRALAIARRQGMQAPRTAPLENRIDAVANAAHP